MSREDSHDHLQKTPAHIRRQARDERNARVLIYLQAIGVALGYLLAVDLMDVFYVKKHVRDSGLAFGYAFCLVQGGIIAFLLALSMVMKFVRQRRENRWNRLRPRIVDHASAYLAGDRSLAALRRMQKRYRREVELSVAEILARVSGDARVRLSAMADGLGLVEQWKDRYDSWNVARRKDAISKLGLVESEAVTPTLILALADPEDSIKLEASRILIRTSGPREIAAVFRAAIRESLLVRAVLTEALRPHALLLAESAVPAALAHADAGHVRKALEIVRAWGQSLPLPDLGPLLHHAEPEVRAAALALVPQIAAPREFDGEILRALADADERVRASAAEAAGKLRITTAAAALEQCLEASGPEATVAAAYALARLGPEGCQMLEGQVRGKRTAAACAALEALEQARSGRLLMAVV